MIKKIAFYLCGAVVALVITGCVCCCGEKTADLNDGITFLKLSTTNPPPPIEHHPLPPGEPGGTLPCGSFCNYVYFNNYGAGYTAVDTTYSLKITHGDGGAIIPNSKYHLYWVRTASLKGCASNSGTDDKTFVSAAGAKYVFSVYFKPGECANYNVNEIYLLPSP
jgi:hypothetical protein